MVGIFNEPFDALVLTKYPFPVAVAHRRVLECQDWRTKLELSLRLFDYSLRVFTIFSIAQYLIPDAEQISDSTLNELLLKRLPRATLGGWKQMLFASLDAYAQKRGSYFMKELYDLYWDASSAPHRRREGTQTPYDHLIQVRNDYVHRVQPATDVAWQALGEEVSDNLHHVLMNFRFVQNYDLIRIIDQHDSEYRYVIYTGERPIVSTTPLHSDKKLNLGWVYCLSKTTNDLLQLYPFMIYREFVSNVPIELQGDIAIYDSFTRSRVTYIATVVQQLAEDASPTTVAEFFHILYYNIEKVKQQDRGKVLEDVQRREQNATWDVFISHAWEDKDSIARPLAKALQAAGLRVWFDEFTLRVGDRLSRSIDLGLANSRYGVVILSPSFFAKEWPQKELAGLVTREDDGSVVILPVWYNITAQQIRRYSPSLADRVAAIADNGLDQVVADLLRAIRPI